jgi:hypothetical protein
LTYVDYCLFFAREQSDIDAVIYDLRHNDQFQTFQLNIEESVVGFLGIFIERKEGGAIELLETGLIDRILTTLGLQNCRENSPEALADTMAVGVLHGIDVMVQMRSRRSQPSQ